MQPPKLKKLAVYVLMPQPNQLRQNNATTAASKEPPRKQVRNDDVNFEF